MNLLRSIFLDNLGLKLIALLMALLVYFNAYTDRPNTRLVAFPVQIDGLADTLSLSGPRPEPVRAELRGTGKQIIRLLLTEPRLRVSVAGVAPGRFERSIAESDLPLGATSGLSVERLIGPRMLQLQIDHLGTRQVPLAGRVSGVPGTGFEWTGDVLTQPASVKVTGPARVLAELDSVTLPLVRIDGRRDTVRANLAPDTLPDWCTASPALVRVLVPLRRRAP